MNEYDEVELLRDHPAWGLAVGVRGAIVDTHRRERGFVTVEFFGPNEEHAVHLVSVDALRVTGVYHATPTLVHDDAAG